MQEDPKPGWLTTEWWSVLACKLISLVALLGVIPYGDVVGLQDSASKAFAALGIVLAQVLMVVHYVHCRTGLKRPGPSLPPEDKKGGLPLNVVGLLILALVFLPTGVARAEEPVQRSRFVAATARPVTKTGVQIGFINLGCGKRKPADPAPAPVPAPVTDPLVLAELKRIGDLQAMQVALLQAQAARGATPAPAPAPPPANPGAAQPHIIIISPPGAGTPKVELPGDGTPKITLPGDGTPRITLPGDGTPKITLPPGGAPKAPLPEGGAPKITLPGAGASAPPPAGFMRYTTQRRTNALYK